MEDLKRRCNCRKRFWVHLKALLSKANETIEQHSSSPTECYIPVLTNLRHQLQRKNYIISDLDSQIVKLIQDEDKLVGDVCEAEEIKEALWTTIAQITQFLDSRSTPAADTPPSQQSLVTRPHSQQPTVQDTSQQVELSHTEETPTHIKEGYTEETHTKDTHTEHAPPITQPRLVAATSQGVARLPKLSIPTFSGDPSQ